MKETRQRDRTVVEHTSPIWRVLGVALACGAVAALGYYFQIIGYVDEFATIFVITLAVAATGWCKQRPDLLKRRLGVFGSIAVEAQNSAGRIQAALYARPLRFLVPVGICYGLFVVVAKALVVALLENIWAWPLAVALGCGIGALVAAPEFYGGLFRRMSVPDDEEEADEALEDEDPEADELARRRAGGEE